MAEAKPDSRNLRFVDINDFSPGIYDNSLIASSNIVANPEIFPAPPGAASVVGTFNCMALPNGGLGPGPALGGTIGTPGLSLLDMGFGAGSNEVDITALTNAFSTAFDELVIGTTPAPTGTQSTGFHSYVVVSASLNLITSVSGTFTAGNKNYCTFPFTTTINTGFGFQPVVVLPLSQPANTTSDLMIYPDPSTPSTFSVFMIANTGGTAFGHQGRIIKIRPYSFTWPFTTNEQFANEAFDYTDPPLSGTWPGQQEIFGPENPSGYGAMASVSAGELFAVKNRGGGIIIQGDLNNPTVTSLPGLKSTGVIYGKTDTDPNGFYYCAQNQGAWVWGGGNASSKISGQLDDNFFSCINNTISDTHYYGYYVQRWADWMVFSNNWIYNTTTNSWWRFGNPNAQSMYWAVPGYNPRFMYVSPQSVGTHDTKFLFQYDRGTPCASYSWLSLPIKLPSEDRQGRVREVIIRASNPYADATPTITPLLISDNNGTDTLATWNMTPGINTIQENRFNAGMHTTSVSIQLSVSGTLYAPVIHSISLGYAPHQHLGVD